MYDDKKTMTGNEALIIVAELQEWAKRTIDADQEHRNNLARRPNGNRKNGIRMSARLRASGFLDGKLNVAEFVLKKTRVNQ